MAELTLTTLRIAGGVWEGVATGSAAPPQIEALHHGVVLAGLEIRETADGFALRLALPATLLSEGVQTVVFRDARHGQTLGHISILAGAPPETDLRAEIDLLRAELDLLKRAFRRHCSEGGS